MERLPQKLAKWTKCVEHFVLQLLPLLSVSSFMLGLLALSKLHANFSLKSLHISGNPLHCDCEMLAFLPEVLQKFSINATCFTPPWLFDRNIMQLVCYCHLRLKYLICLPHRLNNIFYRETSTKLISRIPFKRFPHNNSRKKFYGRRIICL